MPKQIIATKHAPQTIGSYSQAVRTGNTVYISGQIPLDPQTMQLVTGDFAAQTIQVLRNLEAIASACGCSLKNVVRFGVYLIDIDNFAIVNTVFNEFLSIPFPARSLIQVAALPKRAEIEIDAILDLSI